MKDQRTCYGIEDKHSLVQQIHILDVNHHSFGKNWTYMTSTSVSYGRLADEMQVEVEFLKFPIGLKGQ